VLLCHIHGDRHAVLKGHQFLVLFGGVHFEVSSCCSGRLRFISLFLPPGPSLIETQIVRHSDRQSFPTV
jgi:hypothetical protein